MSVLRVIYLVWGASGSLQLQARYSVLSALAARGVTPASIHLFTDSREKCADLAGAIEIEPLAGIAAQSTNPFEMKLRVVREASARWGDDAVLFVDADTFFIADMSRLADALFGGRAVLHRREYAIAQHRTPQMRRFRRALKQAAIALQPGDAMWNSGVIGLPAGSAAVADSALQTMAQIRPHTGKVFLAEQFAVSRAVTALGEPLAADDAVFHYWFQKRDYTVAISARMEFWRNLPLEEQFQVLRTKPLRLQPPPMKLHWWERAFIATGAMSRPTEIRGLPR